MGKQLRQKLKTLKFKKKVVMFEKVQAFLMNKFRQRYSGKAKELLQKYGVDVLLNMVISICNVQEQRGKTMIELFTYETAKLIVINTVCCLVWSGIFFVWGYAVMNICQLVWYGIKKFIRKIRNRSKEMLSQKDKQKRGH